jgi:probable F420-dependent oxidoreductase
VNGSSADRSLPLGQVGVWAHLDTLTAAGLHAFARRVEALGYGTLWVPETVGREPFALLGAISTTTSTIRLGTSIASIWARDAQTARMAALTVQEASGGRFTLGLGVSHPHLAERLRGHHYEKPLTRMREYLTAYRAAVWKGPQLDPVGEPPILLAALRERMLTLAASQTAGAFPYLVTARRLAWMRDLLDDVAVGERRPTLAVTLPVVLADGPADPAGIDAARAYLAPYLRAPNYQASWAAQGLTEGDWARPGSDRLVQAMIAIGPPEALQARTRELLEAGADHVALIALAPDGTSEQLPTLEALAPVGSATGA